MTGILELMIGTILFLIFFFFTFSLIIHKNIIYFKYFITKFKYNKLKNLYCPFGHFERGLK